MTLPEVLRMPLAAGSTAGFPGFDPEDQEDIVGVDLSLTATAIARIDGVITHGRTGLTIVTTPLQSRGISLMTLTVELGDLIGTPKLVLLEDFPPGMRMDPERCYLWWSLVNLLGRRGVPVLAVPPSILKLYACGRGDANKREVIAGVREHFPAWEVRKTSKTGKILTTFDDNKADAVALYALGMELLGKPVADLPDQHRKAVLKLVLPPEYAP
jgi:crossover junction endodeoxyribonuclease RuvC